MPSEREWVRGFTKKLSDALGSVRGMDVCAVDGMRLA